MRIAMTGILCAMFAVVSGYARFGSGRHPGVWVDVAFLGSAALVVAIALVVIMERIRRISGGHTEDRDHHDP